MSVPFHIHPRGAASVALGAFVLACAGAPIPAVADAGLGVDFGAQVPTHGDARDAGGHVQTALGVALDVFKPPVIPLRGALAVDYASGARAGGKLDTLGLGAAVRLTTPVYAGAEVGIYDVSAKSIDPAAASHTAVGLGTELFAGERLIGLPGGASLSLQVTYKALPSAGGVNAGAVGAGLHLQL